MKLRHWSLVIGDWSLVIGDWSSVKLFPITHHPSPMSNSSKPDPNFYQFLDGIPPEIAASFTDAQLQAIEQSLKSRTWKRHPLDIRLSLPFPGRRFYVVIVAGPERRSSGRLKEQSKEYPLWTVTNTLVLGVCFVVLVTGVLGIFYGLNEISSSLSSPATNPNAIPGIADKTQCEKTGRRWSNGQCLN